MKTALFVLGLTFVEATVHAGVDKVFPGGYIICIFDRPTTITNHGSKLEVAVQDPKTRRWIPLPGTSVPSAPKWLRGFVAVDGSRRAMTIPACKPWTSSTCGMPAQPCSFLHLSKCR